MLFLSDFCIIHHCYRHRSLAVESSVPRSLAPPRECYFPSFLSLEVIFNPRGSLSNCFYIVCVRLFVRLPVWNIMRKHMPCILNIWNDCENCCGQKTVRKAKKFSHLFEAKRAFSFICSPETLLCTLGSESKFCSAPWNLRYEFSFIYILVCITLDIMWYISKALHSHSNLAHKSFVSVCIIDLRLMHDCLLAGWLSGWLDGSCGVNKMCRVFSSSSSNVIEFAWNSVQLNFKKETRIKRISVRND